MICVACKKEKPQAELIAQEVGAICEDCLMDQLSPAKACDPWAVKAATGSMTSKAETVAELCGLEKKLYALVTKRESVPLEELPRELAATPAQVERSISVLRHMELVRASMREDRGKNIVLFDS